MTATDPSGNNASATYQVAQTGASKTFTYDANGNLTSDGTRTFEWDARDQLVAVTVGQHRSEFTYDGEQHRVRILEKDNGIAVSTKAVVWCEDHEVCEERAADGVTVTRRVLTQGEQVAGVARFFVRDHLGSVTQVTDTAVATLAQYAFDPWGRRSLTGGTDLTDLGFTGHRWHASSGLTFTMFRAYDSELGRWISEDPIGLNREATNLYTYADNNPVNTIDVLGDQALPLPGGVPGPVGPGFLPGIVGVRDQLPPQWPADYDVKESPYPKDKPKPCDDWRQSWGCLAKGHLTPTNKHPNKNQGQLIVHAVGYGPTRPLAEEAAKRNAQHAVPPEYTKGWWYVRHVNVQIVKCWKQ